MSLTERLRYDSSGLVPAVLQDARSLEVLILAYMDRQAVQRTLETGLVHLWSRNRQSPWLKGERSGRLLHVREVRPNCELDSLLLRVEQMLPGACHTGHTSCYYRRAEDGELVEISPPVFDPDEVYGSPLVELLAVYSWLRDGELIAESGTSGVLHGQGPDPLDRLRDEWEELRGVLEGTHSHEGYAQDVRTEAYQVLYWTCLYQLLHAPEADAAVCNAALLEGYAGASALPDGIPWAGHADGLPDVLELWTALGAACRAGGVHPYEVVRRDLRNLLSRPYMRAYAPGSPEPA